MITRWLHVSEFGGDPWVLPIWGMINHATEKGLCQEINQELRELGIHISTRLNMLPVTIGRINTGWKSLYKEVEKYKEDNIFEKNKEAYVIQVKSELINYLLVDINSFLFETNACCELFMKFLEGIYQHRGIEYQKNKLGMILKDLLVQNGQDPNWFQLLDKDRNFFIHNGTPYIAIDVSTEEDPDLVVMKENLKSFEDTKSYTKLSEMDSIVKGFSTAKIILQEHIMGLYQK